MIIDSKDNLLHYQVLLKHLDQALNKIDELGNSWKVGEHYQFEGGFLFFQEGKTKPLVQSQFEAHKEHIDVQIVLSGAEYVALTDFQTVTVALPYNQERDVTKYDGLTEHFIKLSKDMAYICFPWDVHKAIFHIESPLEFTKVVIKLEIK